MARRPDGAWSYLHSFDGFGIDARPAPSDTGSLPTTLPLDLDELRVTSVGVPHGMMPSVAYRVDAGPHSITVSGDVQQRHPPLADLACATSLLVHDMALPERDVPHGHLHAKPTDVGVLAAEAGAAHLLLIHIMPELEDERDAAETLVRRSFHGPVHWARDLVTLAVG